MHRRRIGRPSGLRRIEDLMDSYIALRQHAADEARIAQQLERRRVAMERRAERIAERRAAKAARRGRPAEALVERTA